MVQKKRYERLAAKKVLKCIVGESMHFLFASNCGKVVFSCFYLVIIFAAIVSSCSNHDNEKTGLKTEYADSLELFKELDSSSTGINFNTNIVEDQIMNPIVYEYTYNGGGVAIGDVNNDGLDDIFFTANQKPDKLYLNKGNFKFEDITNASGTGGKPGSWKTGDNMADVNGDG